MNLAKALETLPAPYATDGMKGDLPAVCVFTPDAGATWVLWEYGDGIAFGLCDLGLGFPELGYVALDDLVGVRGALGLPVEVDTSVKTRFEGYRNAGVEVPEFLIN